MLQSTETSWKGTPVASGSPRFPDSDSASDVPDSAMTAAVVLEEEVVIYGLPEFQTAFDVLVGFLYALCSPTLSIL